MLIWIFKQRKKLNAAPATSIESPVGTNSYAATLPEYQRNVQLCTDWLKKCAYPTNLLIACVEQSKVSLASTRDTKPTSWWQLSKCFRYIKVMVTSNLVLLQKNQHKTKKNVSGKTFQFSVDLNPMIIIRPLFTENTFVELHSCKYWKQTRQTKVC